MRLTTLPAIPSTFSRAAFPLGGIGTGNVSLGARGELRDWEVRNQPDKGGVNPGSFFAITAGVAGGETVCRVLEARDEVGRRDWWNGGSKELQGLPRLRSSTLRGEYPFARVEFSDDELPVHVVLTAFTPLVPLHSDDSGIPAAVLRYTVSNPTDATVAVLVTGSLGHLAGAPTATERQAQQTVSWRDEGGVRGLDFGVELDPGDLRYGTMALLTTDESASAMPVWPRGRARDLWRAIQDAAPLVPVAPEQLEPDEPAWAPHADWEVWGDFLNPRSRIGSLAIRHELDPGETRDFDFVIAWSFPNRVRGWDGDVIFSADGALPDLGTGRNHYASIWPDAWSAGGYLLRELDRLEGATARFHDALFRSTVDPAVLDAVSSSIATLRSTTCFRLEGGDFFGWEGTADSAGMGGGTCTHVWHYAQTVAWLFPDLERSARRTEYLRETDPDGRQDFRVLRGLGGPSFGWPPAVDGQLGTILRLHREWRFSGDDAFLRELWPAARAALDYVIREWDTDGDGVLDALMHNTYDIEFLGSEPMSNVLLLAALGAGERMASALGDSATAERYRAQSASSAPAIDALLYNGEYYQQHGVDPATRINQYGAGVLSDQLLGQFHAHLGGLGYVLPVEHVRSAARAIFRANFRPDVGVDAHAERSFAVPGEAGLVTASWPRGDRPPRPFGFADEVWSGIEYQVATELVFDGHVDEGLTILRAVRARHTGEFRSPWNEIEAGNHYVRSMSAWGVLIALSGVQYDAPTASLSFDPVADGTYFFSTGTGWGTATIEGDRIDLSLDHGHLNLARLTLRGTDVATSLALRAP